MRSSADSRPIKRVMSLFSAAALVAALPGCTRTFHIRPADVGREQEIFSYTTQDGVTHPCGHCTVDHREPGQITFQSPDGSKSSFAFSEIQSIEETRVDGGRTFLTTLAVVGGVAAIVAVVAVATHKSSPPPAPPPPPPPPTSPGGGGGYGGCSTAPLTGALAGAIAVACAALLVPFRRRGQPGRRS